MNTNKLKEKENNMKLTLTYKSVFGRDSYYPDDDDISKVIARLAGCTTFVPWQIKLMKDSGWEIEVRANIPD